MSRTGILFFHYMVCLYSMNSDLSKNSIQVSVYTRARISTLIRYKFRNAIFEANSPSSGLVHVKVKALGVSLVGCFWYVEVVSDIVIVSLFENGSNLIAV